MMHKTDMRQDIQEILLTEEQIRTRVQEMGKVLTEEYRGKEPVVIGILKGVVPFYTAMTQAMDLPMVQDFMVISSYSGTESTGSVVIRQDLRVSIEGRHVLLLEDIVDSGLSLSRMVSILKDRKPASLKVCTLLDKPSGRKVSFTPDMVGFTVPDAFVVGYGLDYNEHYRNLPFVGIVKKEVYTD